VIRSSPLRADNESNDSSAQQPKGVDMRRLATPVAVIALLAAGGFAAVSIASGGGLGHGTTTGLTTTAGGKVTICHRTGSKKKPFHTITVAVPAVRAHLKHGDVLGPCTVATVAAMKKHGRGAAKHTTTTTTTTTSTTAQNTSAAHGNSGAHGNGGEHGNAGGNGHGGGGGKH
jgi:uncharacterized membrane protein YgcG